MESKNEGNLPGLTPTGFEKYIKRLDILYFADGDTIYLNPTSNYFKDLNLWNNDKSWDDGIDLHEYVLTLK